MLLEEGVTVTVKDEPYDDFKQARLIFSRDDHFKVRVGPMFKRIEKELFKLPFFIKKVPVWDRSKFIKRLYEPDATYYACDYTSFETHFVRQIMRGIEFELYKYMAPDDAEGHQFIKDLEVLVGQNMCSSKLVSLEVEACRMSGEMNTSLGNGFCNLIFMMYACHVQGITCDGIVEGDDGVFRMSKELNPKIFDEMGLNIKLEKHSNLFTMSFCGLICDELSL